MVCTYENEKKISTEPRFVSVDQLTTSTDDRMNLSTSVCEYPFKFMIRYAYGTSLILI